jgi:hypothetical protein
MPPQRTIKLRERMNLVNLIELKGLVMPSCSYCLRNHRKCIVAEESSSRCSECVRRGCSCDVEGPSAGDLESLLREQQRISQERKETLAKLLRLDRQEDYLRTKGSEMLRRGLKTLDELDEIENKEKEESKRKEREEADAATATANDLESDPFAFLQNVPWADLDFGDGTLPTSQGSEG